jgi:hypothetical protein
MGGIAPSVIDWGERGPPAATMTNLGVTLVEFSIEHPDPTAVRAVYERLGLQDPLRVREGAQHRYRALIKTSAGLSELY